MSDVFDITEEDVGEDIVGYIHEHGGRSLDQTLRLTAEQRDQLFEELKEYEALLQVDDLDDLDISSFGSYILEVTG